MYIIILHNYLLIKKYMETLIEVKKNEQNWILIFNFKWELDETNVDKTFASIQKDIWDFNNKKIIFDLSWLKYLNSKSIWYIADTYSNLEENNWMMYICWCDEWVKDILELVWITTIIPTVDSLEDAIKAIS